MGIGTRLFGGAAAVARYQLKREEGALAATVQENVRAQAVIKVFGLRTWVAQRFSAQLAARQRRFTRADFLAEVVGTSSSLGVLAVQVLVLGVGAHLAVTGRLSAGTLVAFLSLRAIVSKDMYDLTKKVVASLIASAGGLQRLEEITREPIEVREDKGARPLPAGAVTCRVDEVTFAYPGGTPVLQGVSLEVPAGRRVALVGSSGSGKSAVLGLLLRFFDPQGGRVLVNGLDLRGVALDSLYARLAAVFQERFLFDGPVRDNIALGKVGASDAEMQAAARGDAVAVRVRPHHLQSVPLLGGVEEAAPADVAARMVVENGDAGLVVVQEGEEGERFFVIARGRVEVTLQVGGTIRHIATLDDGDVFGEQAWLAGARRTATVRTLTPCLLLVLERAAFAEVVRAHPTLPAAVQREAAHRRAKSQDLQAAFNETTLLER